MRGIAIVSTPVDIYALSCSAVPQGVDTAASRLLDAARRDKGENINFVTLIDILE